MFDLPSHTSGNYGIIVVYFFAFILALVVALLFVLAKSSDDAADHRENAQRLDADLKNIQARAASTPANKPASKKALEDQAALLRERELRSKIALAESEAEPSSVKLASGIMLLFFGAVLTYAAIEFKGLDHWVSNLALFLDMLGGFMTWSGYAAQKLAAQRRDVAYRKAGLAPPGTSAPSQAPARPTAYDPESEPPPSHGWPRYAIAACALGALGAGAYWVQGQKTDDIAPLACMAALIALAAWAHRAGARLDAEWGAWKKKHASRRK
jgi:hypothetical protein